MQSFLPIFFSLSAGSLGDRFGHARVLVVGGLCSTLSLIIYYFGFLDTTPDYLVFPLWSLGMVMSGMAWLFFWIALQSLATHPLAKDDEGKLPSVSQMIYAISLTMSFGLILGPVATGYTLDFWDAEVFWVGQILLSLFHAGICIWMAFMVGNGTRQGTSEDTSAAFKMPSRSAWTLGFPDFIENWSKFGGRPYISVLLVSLVMLFSVDLMATFVPAHLGDAGMSESNIGLLMIGGHTAGVILRLVLALKWIHFSERSGLVAALLFCTLGLALMALLPPNFSWILVGVALGLGIGLGEPMGMQIIATHAAPERRGLALGGRALVNRIGMFLAPYVGFKAFASLGAFAGGLLLAGGVAVVGIFAMVLYSSEKKEH